MSRTMFGGVSDASIAYPLFVFLIAGAVADYVSTVVGLSIGAQELNPLLMLAPVAIPGTLLFIKVAIVGLGWLFVLLQESMGFGRSMWYWSLLAICGIEMFVCISNVVQLA